MKCWDCNRELPPVFPELGRRKDDKQFKNALHIKLSGTYGEYIDGQVELIYCGDCAVHFLKIANPALDIAVKQYLDTED